jgi:2-octaprenyl-6-methoxyphenol hydroxylase
VHTTQSRAAARPVSIGSFPDIAIVGAGPVGGTLALAIAQSGHDVVALDAREAGSTLRADRSLAISHGGRLIFERLGIFGRLASTPGAVTPITAIDISQARAFGTVTLTADEQSLPALGYVISYRALQTAIDDLLARTGIGIRHACEVTQVQGTPEFARVTVDGGDTLRARLAVIADGTGAAVAGVSRKRREYGQVALIAKVTTTSPHAGVAYERFTESGPVALLPEVGHYGLVWTMTPQAADQAVQWADDRFLSELRAHFGARRCDFTSVRERKTFPLALELAEPAVAARAVLVGNAAQSLHPVAGQGFNLGLRDAFELAQEINEAPRDSLGSHAMLARYAARRRVDRYAGVAFTHGLTHIFALDGALFAWPRGLALAALDALPFAKRAFTRAMLFGLS